VQLCQRRQRRRQNGGDSNRKEAQSQKHKKEEKSTLNKRKSGRGVLKNKENVGREGGRGEENEENWRPEVGRKERERTLLIHFLNFGHKIRF